MQLKRATILTIVALLAIGLGALYLWPSQCPSRKGTGAPSSDLLQSVALDLDEPALKSIALFARASWQSMPADSPPALAIANRGVYLAVRAAGERLGETWAFAPSAGEGLAEAIDFLRQELGASANAVDTLEVFLTLGTESIDATSQRKRLYANIRRGVVGLQIGTGEDAELYSPTYIIASNRKNKRLIELYAAAHRCTSEEMLALSYRFLLGPQLLIDIANPDATTLLMERGNRLVALDEVEPSKVSSFVDAMSDWMWNSLHEDGRMTYLYYPSQGKEAPGKDNLIRQFMATIALGRVAAHRNDASLWARSARNIDYNLSKYYVSEGGFGTVELNGKVKLGAMALAALAIVEHPERKRWSKEEAALRRSIQSLWHEDGSFTTFYKPAGRNDNQNFYPGETLLLWASLYAETRDKKLLAQFMKSFRYYRSWHLDEGTPGRRNPAFIPWHTQAYYMVWRETKDEELRDFIFKMNDWLLGVQQWDDVDYADTQGRFYDPKRPFGPPHASATGVYLEGLIDAYQLAASIGDTKRQARYSQAIHRGLRSSMQLQFVDAIDMYYVHDKKAVRGGLRTTVYDNKIRCDNVQHTLMGTLKILDSDVLTH